MPFIKISSKLSVPHGVFPLKEKDIFSNRKYNLYKQYNGRVFPLLKYYLLFGENIWMLAIRL